MRIKKTGKRRTFIVAAVNSGAGKTIVTLAIMEALRRRGLPVQPFKAGPDYIDPGHHRALLKRPSYNLDTWMMGPKAVKDTFARHASVINVIEGVMGLFDGRDGRSEDGSTAHISKVLNVPVILVVDASRMARSAGAVISGFEGFDPEVRVRWVVFNRVGSLGHYKVLKDSILRGSKVKALGYLPRDAALSLPERHLGLVTSVDLYRRAWQRFVKKAGTLAEEFLDIDALLRSPEGAPADATPADVTLAQRHGVKGLKPLAQMHGVMRGVRIAIARDRAFCFYYEENLELLESYGAELVFFSPIKDKRLPAAIGGVYIGGGYPELYAKALEDNRTLREEIKSLSRSGMPVYAECGGLMYLGKALRDAAGKRYELAGVFPWASRMLKKRKALGYREVKAMEGCPFIRKGSVIRGHEYHYSEISGAPSGVKRVFRLRQKAGEDIREGYLYKNTLASYAHLHFASNPAFARGFVEACKKFHKRGER